jgi:DNA polymerase III epsilon subunit-like protein
MKILVIKCVTTGLPKKVNPQPTDLQSFNSARLLEFACIKYDTTKDEELSSYQALIKPNGFPVASTHIHGITQEMANKGESIENILAQLKIELEDCSCLISHNIKFDIKILLSEIYRLDDTKLYNLILNKFLLCTMIIGTNLFEEDRFISLTKLASRLGIIQSQSYRASDANLVLKCLVELKKLKLLGKNVSFKPLNHSIEPI